MQKEVKYVEGFSESLWVSLAVKAIRMGWPAGLEKCLQVLGKSRLKQTLMVQVVEDVYPHRSEYAQVVDEVKALNFEALCSHDTRHAVPGLTEKTVPIVLEWCSGKRSQKSEGARLYPAAREVGIYLTWRIFSEFDAWLSVRDEVPKRRRRPIDATGWRGMLEVARDGHTVEGKKEAKRRGIDWLVTLLSGSEPQHLEIARRVQAEKGWGGIRRECHESLLEPGERVPQQQLLF